MNKKFSIFAIAMIALFTQACTRISNGEVGVRVNMSKQVEQGELQPGTWNQTVFGNVITFPVKDVAAEVDDMTPIAKDNSTMSDFDMTIIYNINPSQVAELYSTKSKSFHLDHKGDTYLMFNYVTQAARNAVYKAAREYEALDMNDNRQAMEQKVKETIQRTLMDEKLDSAITISQIQIRKIQPSQAVIESANALVRAKNEQKQKEVEVRTAKLEAEKQQALSANGPQTIEYMKAQSSLIVANAIAAGKVQTIIVPHNMTMLGGIQK